MKQLKILISFACISLFMAAPLRMSAQHSSFIMSGVITYEKRVNDYALIRKFIALGGDENVSILNDQYNRYQSSHPQFHTSESTLAFSGQQTYYQPNGGSGSHGLKWSVLELPYLGQSNFVYMDHENNTFLAAKHFFGQKQLVADSLSHISWRITDEIRTIAGFSCRRANAIIMDSIYAVAYFTDKIPVSGGPETMHGLPGMILGLALPYEHTTWFATKFNGANGRTALPAGIKEADAVSAAEFQETVKTVSAQHGQFSSFYEKAFLF